MSTTSTCDDSFPTAEKISHPADILATTRLNRAVRCHIVTRHSYGTFRIANAVTVRYG
ncbi:hypothetical protein [Nocardia neocaledoniensis]|uniref:hypothetical protein n=1 Tax=Nocardia neocaledoniensis TaxID=236511 RepID=UPI00142DE33D|nr:hypothetical protein [Nocardia neocaledoniensis]